MEIRVWTDGETQATLTLGDCIEIMAGMEPESIHAIVAAWSELGE